MPADTKQHTQQHSTAAQHSSTATLSAVVQQHSSTAAQQHSSTAAQQQNSTTAQQHSSTATQQHYPQLHSNTIHTTTTQQRSPPALFEVSGQLDSGRPLILSVVKIKSHRLDRHVST
jgi:hypothetical protein